MQRLEARDIDDLGGQGDLDTASIADSCRSSREACSGCDYCDKRDEACFHSMGVGVVFGFAEADQVWSTPDICALSFTSAKFLRFRQRVAKTH